LKDHNEQTLKEAISKLLDVYRLQNGLDETKLINKWDEVVGDLISKHTENLFIKNKKLYVKLDSPALKHELSFAREKLVQSLNKAIDKNVIEEIHFI